MTSAQAGAVRRHLAQATRAAHEALHEDPVLRRLSAPSLTAPAYHRALSVFATFYGAVEQARGRAGVYDRFSLAPVCTALALDGAEQQPHRLACDGPLEVLGALYVAHGAAFGRGTFRANAVAALLQHPHRFVRLRLEPSLWAALSATLDDVGGRSDDLEAITRGAARAFELIGAAASAAAEPRIAAAV